MEAKNVFTLPQQRGPDPTRSSQLCPPMPLRVLELGAEVDRPNLKLLPKFHGTIEGLVEKMDVVDAQIESTSREAEQAESRWSAFGNHSVHWTPLHWGLMWFGLTLLTVAETALAATVMAGLDLTDAERWLVAAGSTVGATLGVKALAIAWRALADDEHDNIPVSAKHRWAIWFGVGAILLVLAGQFLARESYADQAQAAGSAGVTWMVAAGLTLLQCGLYCAAAFFLFMRLPHVRTQSACEQVKACRKVLTRLHSERAKLAAPLNRAVFSLRAQWAEHQALGRSLIFEYLQEMANAGKPVDGFSVDNGLFAPLPTWVMSADERSLVGPADRMVARGHSSPSEMAQAAARRNAVLLGRAYPPLHKAPPTLQPLPPSGSHVPTTPSSTGESS